MKKMTWIALILCLVMIAGCTTTTANPTGTDSVKVKGDPFEALSLIDIGKIERINFTVAGEDGVKSGSTMEQEIISMIIEKLTGVEVNKETNMAVDDDDLDIEIVTEQTILRFAFEGDVLVVGDKRYEVSNLEPLKTYILSLLD